MKGIRINGTGLYVPKTIATNEDFTKIIETNDEWITTRTGIKQRHIANGEPAWYLGAQAAKQAVENAKISVDEISIIIFTTVTSDFATPSAACVVQRELGVPATCMAFDLNAACSGFVYAVDTARALLSADENKKYALVISAECLSKFVDYSDRSSCILFGDGAAAAVISLSDTMYTSHVGADGTGAGFLFARSYENECPFNDGTITVDDKMPPSNGHFLAQDGHEVYKFAVKAMPNAVFAACEKAKIDVSDIDLVIPHQANVRIIKAATKTLGLSEDKVFVNIENYGNTSSATIPIALHEAITQGRLKRGDKVCLVGFGAGLTYGAVIFEY